jgi:hypothetical protein
MRSISSILVREGPTDDSFFRVLLRRVVEDLTASYASWPVSVDEPITIYPEGGNGSFADRIGETLRESGLNPHLAFYHTDAGGDLAAAYAERVDPVAHAVSKVCPTSATLGVVPQREMEAWPLADPGGLARALGVEIDLARMVSQPPRRVDRILDPKAELADLVMLAQTSTRGPRRKRQVSAYLGAIAEELSFDSLRRVAQYALFEQELLQALRSMGVVDE